MTGSSAEPVISEGAKALRPWHVSAIGIPAGAAFAIFDWSAFASLFPVVLVATVLIGTVRWAQGEIARLEARIELLEEQSDATLELLSSDLPDA